MIERFDRLYALHTRATSYLFRIGAAGHPEHLYYGTRIRCDENTEAAIAPRRPWIPGSAINYSHDHPTLCMEQLCGEVSTLGKGDTGEPFVELTWSDGSRTCDFVFENAEIVEEKPRLEGLPGAYGKSQTLRLTLKSAAGQAARLVLLYTVFEDCDVITRSARLDNGTDGTLTLHRLASAQVDFEDSDFVYTCFTGGWVNEMNRRDTPLRGVSAVSETRAGVSSNRANPFVMLSRPEASETAGEVYGMNLIYSGSHREIAQCGANNRLRLMTGIQPDGFCWQLAPGESFQAPEAVLCYSDHGYRLLSHRLHRFVREHIVRGQWQKKPRPVLLNSWESCYFNFNEGKLLRLARTAKDCGAELFVMDDGWFGDRSSDDRALGDWTVNTAKLPGGLKGLAKKVNALGLSFGLWMEPEMVNVNSRLYSAHPDWVMQAPMGDHSEGRNQRILDLCNPAVQDFMRDAVSNVLSSANIAYLKWDMNRIFSDVFSPSLPADRQGEAAHRYVLGLYRVLEALTAAFPAVLFESCASGGNRADLGMLCYMPQVWASDNTDAICRAEIQRGYSYGYPMSVLGCHVSAVPNHQTLRKTSLATRYQVAMTGLLGYELNLNECTAEDRKEIAAQIAEYKAMRDWLQFADYYRLPDPAGRMRWMAVAADRSNAAAVELQLQASVAVRTERFTAAGLAPDALYRVTQPAAPVDIRPFGALVNMVSPVHLRPGGAVMELAARVVKLPGDSIDVTLSGSALMRAGIGLPPPFQGAGFDSGTKYYPDFTSRLYRMEKVSDPPAPQRLKKAEAAAADTAQ